MEVDKAIQLIRSIGYVARASYGCLVVEDGAQIHCVPLSLVQAWVWSH